MIKKRLFVFAFLLMIASSCNFVVNNKISGNYHLVAVDIEKDICLAYKLEPENYICIVPSEIIAYCELKQYILIKQVPFQSYNSSDTNYYIVPIIKGKLNVFPEDSIIGPLKREEFNKEVLKKNLMNWKFKNLR